MNKKYNLAVLAPEAVYPANTGGRLVVFNKIKYLREYGYNVSLFCIVDSDEEAKKQDAVLAKLGIKSHSYNRNACKKQNLLNIFKHPYAVASRDNVQLKKDLGDLIKQNQIDIIDVEFPQMAINVMNMDIISEKAIKIVLNQHNIEYRTMKNIGQTFDNPIKRIVFKFEASRLRKYEERIYRSDLIDGYTFVSSDDLRIFKEEHPQITVPCKVFSIGADDHGNTEHKNNQNVIIVGKMSYQPNIEGVLWFYQRVWPMVKKSCPNSRLYIVGKDPSESLTEIEDTSVFITGTVDSVEPYYANSSVVAIPIFSGGGVKTKLIEAASYGLPIVTTPAGVLGTNFTNDQQVIVTEDATEFAQNIVAAIDNDQHQLDLAKCAHELFVKEYTWSGICQQMSNFLKSLLG
ncbi:glycosyltransferase family 4 protein [Lactobacillus porci]|uniref:glycosyltransferase family 4 protein n=1 Tax=Lactobacillus porci TaxID=2012477 RepID=UPI0039952E31